MRPHPLPPLLQLTLSLAPLPAAIWIGEGDPMDWGDAANWSEGARPIAGETIWIRPLNAQMLTLGGGESEPLDLIFDSANGLTLHLAEGTRLGTVTTVQGAHHELLGAPLGGSSRWNLMAWSGFTIHRLADWAEVELASGDGGLILGPQDLDGVTPATVVARSGSVMIDDIMGPMHEGIELVLDGGIVSFNWNLGRLGAVRIGDNHAVMDGFSQLEVGRFEVVGTLSRDLRPFPFILAEEVALRSAGTVTLGGNLSAGRVSAEVAELDLDGIDHGFALRLDAGRVANGTLSGDIRVTEGTLACATSGLVEVLGGALAGEGLVVGGLLRVEESQISGDLSVTTSMVVGGGTSLWSGQLTLEEGARVTWVPSEAAGAVIELTGEWILAGAALLAIGETDWASPYWDLDREVRLVDIWEGGSVAGAFTLEAGAKGDEGAWSLRQAEDGDLLLAWTALGAAPVPEAAAVAPVLGALALALSARRRRARPR